MVIFHTRGRLRLPSSHSFVLARRREVVPPTARWSRPDPLSNADLCAQLRHRTSLRPGPIESRALNALYPFLLRSHT